MVERLVVALVGHHRRVPRPMRSRVGRGGSFRRAVVAILVTPAHALVVAVLVTHGREREVGFVWVHAALIIEHGAAGQRFGHHNP